MKVKEIIEKIDTSKMEINDVCVQGMCEEEFNIYQYIDQPDDNIRLTYCWYHRWICTDTEVGIRVWYYDNEPVCVSWKPYRKSNESFSWLSVEKFNTVRKYLFSFVDEEYIIDILDDQQLTKIISDFESIEHKKFEQWNIK